MSAYCSKQGCNNPVMLLVPHFVKQWQGECRVGGAGTTRESTGVANKSVWFVRRMAVQRIGAVLHLDPFLAQAFHHCIAVSNKHAAGLKGMLAACEGARNLNAG